ncbi:ComEC/Rec2 family competence protein [Ekhidna sp.]|uniref:ComEC/Rec2 family competence protein n=1 Tax=Ekhidna sp. TaxID=2608089 RepID=UPI0032F035DD
MYFWNSYPFVRLTIALILGIFSFDHFSSLWTKSIITLCLGFLSYSILVILSHKFGFYKLRLLNGTLAISIIFFIGGCFTKFIYHNHTTSHYTNLNADILGFSGTIASPVNERTNHYRFDFELDQVITKSDSIHLTEGIIHLYVRKDSSGNSLKYGDQLNIYGGFYPVPGPDNPDEFNYQLYLKRQNIYSHAFVKTSDIKVNGNYPQNRFLSWAYSLREVAAQTIDKNIQNPRENGIAKALLIGIKDYLDNDVKQAYSSAGAMHVLAVSGLHVGIIFLIIKLFLGRLRAYGKWGKYAFGFISVFIIWLYATVTGLSPSVLRAATMFSLVAISQASVREGNIYNTLGFAAFILLIFDPYLIYSVGFQLSFAAVIGIVYLQPKLYRLLDFRLWLTDKAWAITCVSIAAQLATFPLSVYYFHQFPTYFLASNLIVIPAAFIMLVGGMSMLIIEPIYESLSTVIGQLLGHFMWLINEMISYVDILPNSLIEWIYIDQMGLLLTYSIVFTLIAGFHYRSFKTIFVSASLAITFIGWTFFSNLAQSKRQELVFYEISNKLAIDHIDGHQARLYLDEFKNEELELLSFQINPHRLSSHLQPIAESFSVLDSTGFKEINEIKAGMIAGKRFLILDSTTFHVDFKKIIETDFIVINNQAIKSLKWLKEHFSFETVIISNRNSNYYSRKMKDQATSLDIKIHSLKADGSLKIDLKKDIKKERTIQSALFTTNPD